MPNSLDRFFTAQRYCSRCSLVGYSSFSNRKRYSVLIHRQWLARTCCSCYGNNWKSPRYCNM